MSNCAPELALDRAHHEVCAECRAAWQGLGDALERVRKVPLAMPGASRREEVRTSLLAAAGLRSAASPRPPAGRVAAVFVAAAAGVAVAFGVARARPSADVAVVTLPSWPHATIAWSPGTQLDTMSGPPDEVVRLHDGQIHVEVSPLGEGERFRIAIGGDEIEVRGTAFDVSAEREHLTAVHVAHGRVEVRVVGQASVVVGAGESWSAPQVTASTPVPPSPVPVPVPEHRVHRAPAPSPAPALAPSPPPAPRTETEYDAGWSALRAGDFARAATTFAHAAAAAAPDSALADDAAYWHAVALARIPHPADAIVAFRAFLGDHPGSAHGGEASAALGWLLVDAGETDEARLRFRAAADDPDPKVAKSARAGLAAIK